MKKKRILLFFFVIMISACFANNAIWGSAQSNPEASEAALNKTQASSTATVFSIATKAITYTPHSTATFVFGFLRDKLIAELSDNSDCELPCVLGFSPGIIDQDDALARLIQEFPAYEDEKVMIKEVSIEEYNGFNAILWYENSFTHLNFGYENVELLDTSTTIDNIYFGARQRSAISNDGGEELFGAPLYQETTNYYSSYHILKTYGPPTLIVLDLNQYDGQGKEPYPDTMKLGYFYADQNFYIEYYFLADYTAGGINLCPHLGSFGVMTWAMTDDPNRKLFYQNEYIDSLKDIPRYVEFEVASGMSQEHYYNVMSGEELACIEIPTSYWNP